MAAMKPRTGDGPLEATKEGRGIVTDEKSGILYTCRGGFIDIAHVRDNADRTFYLAAQIGRLPATGGTVSLADEGAERRIVVRPLDARLVRKYGIREVVTGLAEWLDFQLSIWHEIATWYRWSSTAFSEQASAFSPEDLYSNLLGLKIAGAVLRRQAAPTEAEYDRHVTAILNDALRKLGPLPTTVSAASPLTARTVPSKAPSAPWSRMRMESTEPTPSATPSTVSRTSPRPARSSAPRAFWK